MILAVAVVMPAPSQAATNSQNTARAAAAALGGGDADIVRLRRYLSGQQVRGPDRVADLATALIVDLGRRSVIEDYSRLKSAVDRVVGMAGKLLANSRILHLGVERGYRPLSPVVALDFGSVGAAAPGFKRVSAQDERLGGRRLVVVRGKPGRLLSSGVRGIERIELDMPENAYRVILLTRKAGFGGTAPFGREIRVNGIPFAISRHAAEQWISATLLADSSSFHTATGRTATSPVGDFAFVHRMRAADQTGGAVIVEGRATGGKLIVELKPDGALPTYLTGLLVEPIQRRSDLIIGGEARRHAISLVDRLVLEEQVLAEANRVLAEAERSGGTPSPVGLGPPFLGQRGPKNRK